MPAFVLLPALPLPRSARLSRAADLAADRRGRVQHLGGGAMSECVFKPGQTYCTRDGRLAFVGYERNGWLFGDIDSVAYRWRASDGRWASCVHGEPSSADLLPPAPPRIREKQWCNVYSHGCVVGFASLEGARDAADDSRTTPQRTAVPCLLIEIVDGEPGE